MITCPQCQSSNPASARFCMSCGSFLPLAVNPVADTRPPASLPPSAVGFTPPSEAAQQTGLAPQEMARSGYLRYTKPAGQTDQLATTTVSDYIPPSTPSNPAPQSQAAMWMAQSNQSGYYYPPPPTLAPANTQSSFGLYIGAAVIALIVMLAAAWFLLWGLPAGTGGAAQGGSSLAPTPVAPGINPPAQGNNVPNLAACGAAQPTPTDATQQAVISTINASNQDQIEALKTLKTDVLKNHTIGAELNSQIKGVQTLQSQGVYEDAKMECINFVSVTIDSATTATARTVETWSGIIHDKSSNRQAPEPANTMHETYHLVKQNGQWFVGKVDIVGQQQQPGQPGQPTPPDNSQ